MSNANLQNIKLYQPQRISFFYPLSFVMGTIFLIVFSYFFYDSIAYSSQTNLYLLPWCFLAGLIISAPSLYLFYKKQFNPFHPLVFPAWAYFFPAFVIGGLVLAFGWSQPYFLAFVQDERFNLPLTLVYISIGYASLAVGFYTPYSKRIGTAISKKLPVWNWSPDDLIVPGIVLLALGFFNSILAFTSGILGYQKVAEIGTFDGMLFMVTLFWLQGSFLLWLCIFRTKKLSSIHYMVIGLLLTTSLLKSAFQGNRGSLLSLFILVSFAFVLSKREIILKHKIIAVFLVIFAILGGMIYGSTFRNVKRTTEQISAEEYIGLIGQTFEKISEQDLGVVLQEGFRSLGERVESVSSVAVVVSTYEKLSIYESSYGLDNNIWKDSVTYLIPRFIWTDKPLATDPASYGDLYFNFQENSFTLTPIGDLLRNFGPWGIPFGMIVLGFLLRIMYSTFIEDQSFSFWRATMYYMGLTSVSYEGSYGLIVPFTIKVLLVAIVGILMIRIMLGKSKK